MFKEVKWCYWIIARFWKMDSMGITETGRWKVLLDSNIELPLIFLFLTSLTAAEQPHILRNADIPPRRQYLIALRVVEQDASENGGKWDTTKDSPSRVSYHLFTLNHSCFISSASTVVCSHLGVKSPTWHLLQHDSHISGSHTWTRFHVL